MSTNQENDAPAPSSSPSRGGGNLYGTAPYGQAQYGAYGYGAPYSPSGGTELRPKELVAAVFRLPWFGVS